MEIKVNNGGNTYNKEYRSEGTKASGASFANTLEGLMNHIAKSKKEIDAKRNVTGNDVIDKDIYNSIESLEDMLSIDMSEDKYYKPNGNIDINTILKDHDGCFTPKNLDEAMDDVMKLWKSGRIDNNDMLEAVKWLKLKEYSLHMKLENEMKGEEVLRNRRLDNKK